MSDLSKLLAAVEGQSPLEDDIRPVSAPSGWQPGVVWDGHKGSVTTGPVYEHPEDWSDLLAARGLDPTKYEVVGDSIRWTSYDGWRKDSPDEPAYSAICYSFKADIRLKTSATPDLEGLYQEVKRRKNPPKQVDNGDTTFVIALSDWQIGNSDGGGIETQIQKLAELPHKLQDQLTKLRKTGHQIDHVLIAGLGDLVEGTCLAAETEVITRDGIFSIEQLAKEGSATIKTDYGSWVEAEIRSFGIQNLRKVTLTRGGSNRKTIYATPEHRWFRLEAPSSNSKRVEATTDELKKGDLLVSNFGKHPSIISPIGVMAGYVFGDGNRSNNNDRQRGCSVNVYRDDFSLLKFFQGHPQSDVLRKNDNNSRLSQTEKSDYIKVSGLPSFMKDIPSMDESLSYLYGWAAGYFAADGSVTNGMLRLVSVSKENLERFEEICARIGIGTNPIKVWKMSGSLSSSEFLYAISLVPSTVPVEFMVHEGKRQKFIEYLNSLTSEDSYAYQKNRARNWRVESIEETDREEEVYCAIVPNTHSFTLANDILTGNCGFYPTQQYSVQLDRREQTKVVRRSLRDLIMAVAPEVPKVTVTAVAGNHGENRSQGKAFTSTNDNDDVAVFEQVAEIFQVNPTAYGHVGFRLPTDRLTTSINLHGQIVAFTHGHLPKPGNNAAQAVWNWWQQQTMGRAHPGVADANILITGHFHHLNIKQQQHRTVIITPSLTQVGDWYADGRGVKAQPGTLTLTINENGWNNLNIL
jgi:hypothetical protein